MKMEPITKEGRKSSLFLKYIVPMFVLALAIAIGKTPEKASATVLYTINYETQTLDAHSSTGRVYMSTDKGKTWESLEDSSYIVDISSLLQTKEVKIYLKTNSSTSSQEVSLMAEPSNDITVVVSGSSLTYSTTSGVAIEYQKGKNGPWLTLGISGTMDTKPMEIKGASLNFRTKAIPTRRAGKIVAIKVSKRPSPPSVKLDGSRLCISSLKAGMQYRTALSGTWLPVILADKTNSVSLYTFSGATSFNNATYTVPLLANTIEIRTLADGKKPTSSSKVIVVPAQPSISGSVSLVNTTLRVTDSTSKAYEYTIIEPNTVLDMTKAKWTTVSPNKELIIKNASVNQILFVRQKSYVDKSTKLTIPASSVYMQTITGITLVTKK